MAPEKSPAFQFYPKDWDTDINVIPMTYEEEGVYFALCRLIWFAGTLPADLNELRLLLKGRPSLRQMQRWWVRVGKCFEICHDRLVHKRLERERQQQKTRHVIATDGGKTRAAGASRVGGKFTSQPPAEAPAEHQQTNQLHDQLSTSGAPADQPASLPAEHQPLTSTAFASAVASASTSLSTTHPSSTPSVAAGETVWGEILQKIQLSDYNREHWFTGWTVIGYRPGERLEIQAPSAKIRQFVAGNFETRLNEVLAQVVPGLRLLLVYTPQVVRA